MNQLPPENPSPGLTEKQEVGTQEVLPPRSGSRLGESELTNTLVTLADTNPRSLGGAVPSALIASIVLEMQSTNATLKKSNAELRDKLDQAVSDLSDQRIENAKLSERTKAANGSKNLRYAGVLCGSILVSSVFPLMETENGWLGIVSGVLGFGLISLCWFSSGEQE